MSRPIRLSYLVADPATKAAAVIDPALDFDLASGKVGTASVEALLATAAERGLEIRWVLETHVHADHLSAASVIKARTGAQIAIGEGISEVRRAFATTFGRNGGQRVRSVARRRRSAAPGRAGNRGDGHPGPYAGLRCLPGRRRGLCRRYVVHARLWHRADRFSGRRCARSCIARCTASLPCRAGPACSCATITRLPDAIVFAWETTVGEQIDRNIHIGGGVSEDDYVAMREARDATLPVPKLLYPSIQVNLRARSAPAGRDRRDALPEDPLSVSDSSVLSAGPPSEQGHRGHSGRRSG